jgi:hypothetical protein
MAQQAVAIPEDIAEARGRLEEWRGAHRKREPLPEELWALAVSLAQQHNIHRVARALGLDYGTLKRRMPGTAKAPTAAFLELISPLPGCIAECSMEAESTSGAKLRIQMKSVPPAGLAAVIRGFLN